MRPIRFSPAFASLVCVALAALPLHAAEYVAKDSNTNAVTESFTISTGVTLTVASGGTLTLSGSVGGTPTGGTLDLGSVTLAIPEDAVLEHTSALYDNLGLGSMSAEEASNYLDLQTYGGSESGLVGGADWSEEANVLLGAFGAEIDAGGFDLNSVGSLIADAIEIQSSGTMIYSPGSGELQFETFGTSLNISESEIGLYGPVFVPNSVAIDTLIFGGGYAVTLTSDDQTIEDVDYGSFISLSSNNATASNRTFNLPGVDEGKILILVWTGANAGELLDSGNAHLSGDWTPGASDTLTLIFTGSAWRELSRSNN